MNRFKAFVSDLAVSALSVAWPRFRLSPRPHFEGVALCNWYFGDALNSLAFRLADWG